MIKDYIRLPITKPRLVIDNGGRVLIAIPENTPTGSEEKVVKQFNKQNEKFINAFMKNYALSRNPIFKGNQIWLDGSYRRIVVKKTAKNNPSFDIKTKEFIVRIPKNSKFGVEATIKYFLVGRAWDVYKNIAKPAVEEKVLMDIKLARVLTGRARKYKIDDFPKEEVEWLSKFSNEFLNKLGDIGGVKVKVDRVRGYNVFGSHNLLKSSRSGKPFVVIWVDYRNSVHPHFLFEVFAHEYAHFYFHKHDTPFFIVEGEHLNLIKKFLKEHGQEQLARGLTYDSIQSKRKKLFFNDVTNLILTDA